LTVLPGLPLHHVLVLLELVGRAVETALVSAADTTSQVLGGRMPGTAALAVAAWLVLSSARRRRLATGAVRRALRDPDPETRRAAVLVAGHHGLARYARVLYRQARAERDDRVLLALAETIDRGGGHGRGRRTRRLRRWADAFVDKEMASTEDGPEAEGNGHGHRGGQVAEEVYRLDALELIAALPSGTRLEAVRPAGAGKRASARRRWRALPDELDALTVLDALEPPRRSRTRPAATLAKGQAGGGERTDIERLLDDLARF
jgi:hypothetical protein